MEEEEEYCLLLC